METWDRDMSDMFHVVYMRANVSGLMRRDFRDSSVQAWQQQCVYTEQDEFPASLSPFWYR